LGWNGAAAEGDWEGAWQALKEDLPNIARRTEDWERQVLENGDLASNLLGFAGSLR
jgi:hypothetical protein